MTTYIINKTGHREGCYSIENVITAKRGDVSETRTLFLIDEPGAWFDDCWNCHVDGMDFEMPTKEAAIRKGFEFWGINLNEVRVYEEVTL